jgi:hypothetical protein
MIPLEDHLLPTCAAATTRKTDVFWSHAAAFGALWGSLEITVGSFVHALHLPLAGVLLAALGGALLVAQRQILPLRGISLATGLVAALCKSVSPGGIILGPMIGIAIEGLLVELAFFLPHSRGAALLAGGLCAFWATCQTILSKVVFYGTDVLLLYLAALRRAGGWLGLSESTGWRSLLGFLAGLCLLGATLGLFGYRVGVVTQQRLRKRLPSAPSPSSPWHDLSAGDHEQ